MGTFSIKTAGVIAACSGLLLLAGCDKHRDDYVDESRGNNTYSAPVVTQAQPSTSEIKEDHGIKYVVLRQGSLISRNLDQWHAVNPEFFTKLSDIPVEVPPVDNTYYPNRGYVIPHVETNPEHPDQKIGRLTGGYLVPKEIHGWVAVDQKTLAELVKKFMTK